MEHRFASGISPASARLHVYVPGFLGKFGLFLVELKANGWTEANFRYDPDDQDPGPETDFCWEEWSASGN